MNLEDFVKLHRTEVMLLTSEARMEMSASRIEHADRFLVQAMRHLVCCWALQEASEKEIFEVTKTYSKSSHEDTNFPAPFVGPKL